jgi:DNA-binding response OmpR family regulator
MAEVLIIDDDAHIRRLISRILRGAGHTVREATDGRSGLEMFSQTVPMLVITDIVMPHTEGIETIRKIHAQNASIPILAISGSDAAIYLRAATELGATASLAKPFGADELLAVVEELLSAAKPPE